MFKPHELASFIKKRVAVIKKSLQIQDHYHSELIVHHRIKSFIKWKAPLDGWINLNIDRASKNNPGPTGAGGVFHGPLGNYIVGFSVNLSICSWVKAKMMGLLHGL